MGFFLLFFSFVFSNEKLDLYSTPSINQVLEIKFDNFNLELVEGIKAFKVDTTIKNNDEEFSVENILLKLNIFNKKLELIGSKIVKVDFSERKPLSKRKTYYEYFIYNLKNFSLSKQNLRQKMKDKIAVEPLKSKNFIFYFYYNDINVKLSDLVPNTISVSPIEAEIKK